MDLGHPEGGSFCYGKHNNNNNNKKSKGERKEEMKEGVKREGIKEENTLPVQAMTVLLFNKTG